MAEVPAAIIEDILNNSRARGEPGSRGASTEKQFLVIRNAAYYEAKFGSGAFPYLIAVRRVMYDNLLGFYRQCSGWGGAGSCRAGRV